MKKLFSLSLFLLLAVASWAQGTSFLDQGIAAYRNGEFDRAKSLFDREINGRNPSPEAYIYRGNVHFMQQRYAQAEIDYTTAMEQRYESRPAQRSGSFRMGNMVILEPDPSTRDNDLYALLYNNRGAARYFQNKQEAAMQDFRTALNYDPTLEMARVNQQQAQRGGPTHSSSGRDSWDSWGSNDSRNDNSSWSSDISFGREGNGSTRGLGRPVSPPKPPERETLSDRAEELRDYRDDGRLSGFSALFAPRPFEKRNIPRRGKVYKEPVTGMVTQDYLKVTEVTITDWETIISVAVTNTGRQSFDARLFPPNSPQAYVLTGRVPASERGERYELRKIEGIETDARGSRIRPGETLTFTLYFDKIDDRLGIVNLIEGDLQTDDVWNFYQIDLTR